MPNTQEGLSQRKFRRLLSIMHYQAYYRYKLEDVTFFDGILPEVKAFVNQSLDYLSPEVVDEAKTPPNKSLQFIPGRRDLSINGIKRSYSIASTPSESAITLLIKNYPNGQFSNYLFKG